MKIMNENLRTINGSSTYDRIAATLLTDADRRNALEALSAAELLVDMAVWIVNKFRELRAHLFLKPSVKH
jgi:hypothetical protein